MTAAELRDIIISPEYTKEVQDLSCYLASIKQERPLVYFLARQLWNRGAKFRLEGERTDLTISGKRFEFKFTYDADMARLSKELDKVGDRLIKEAYVDKPKHGWVALPRLYDDMVNKRADVFVWIILARDLSSVKGDADDDVCVSSYQRGWNKTYPYMHPRYLEVAERFLEKVRAETEFSLIKEEIQTSGAFQSTYHFWLCEFTKQRNQ
jgi:hypothetical protein